MPKARQPSRNPECTWVIVIVIVVIGATVIVIVVIGAIVIVIVVIGAIVIVIVVLTHSCHPQKHNNEKNNHNTQQE